ncbi:MAG: phage minor head protein [Candidatus Nanoarchaeia archaeon]|nr:phage minor head protein [Candidatus Nanoarchaeia archaeon]
MPDLNKLENQVFNYLLSLEAQYSREVQKQLLNALTSIYGEMKKIYDKYAINGKLTRTEMTKYNKYSTMEKQILEKIDPALKSNIKTIKRLLPSQFNESFYHYAWAIDNTTGLRLSWGNVNTQSYLSLFDITNPKNIELQEALKNYGPESKKRIRSVLLNGISLGQSYDQMARDLKKVLNKIYSSAITIIRTEGQTAINAGQAIAYQRAIQNGVKGIDVWSSTKDGKTRFDHRNADGQKRGEDSYFNLGGEKALYPGDPNLSAGNRINCRCTLRFEVEGYSLQLMRTRAEGVLPYMPYNKYAEKFHPDWLKK